VNKIHFALIFTLFTIFIFPILDAFAETKTYKGLDNGAWEVPDNWMPFGVPSQDDDIVIDPLSPVLALRVRIVSDVTISPSGSITTDNGGTIFVFNPGSLTIQGTYTMNFEEDTLTAFGGIIDNGCTGMIKLNDGLLLARVTSGNVGTIINHGTIEGNRVGGDTPPDNSIFLLTGSFLLNSGTLPLAINVDLGTFQMIPSDCFTDDDGDGFDPNVDDCNDDDAKINPGAEEVADGIDNNCNGLVDEDTKKSCEGIKKGNENGNGKRKGHVKAKENNNCT